MSKLVSEARNAGFGRLHQLGSLLDEQDPLDTNRSIRVADVVVRSKMAQEQGEYRE